MFIIGFWLFNTDIVFAHIPFIAEDNHSNKESAFELDDIYISKVIYQRITKNNPESWISFDAKKEETLYFQMGIPYIESLEDYQPSIALLLPSFKADFKSTEDILNDKVQIFHSSQFNNTSVFHEPFTQTKSWILFEQYINLPEDGTYFLVSFSPSKQNGKLWIAIGKKEVFNLQDISKLAAVTSEVRAFHQSDPKSNSFNYIYIIVIVVVLFLFGAIVWGIRVLFFK